jgi:nicotinamidase-related amidase
MPGTAVLIIDLVNDFFERMEVLAQQRAAIVEATNTLVAACRQSQQPVIWVREEFASDLHDAPAEIRKNRIYVRIAGTRGCQWLPELHREPQGLEIIKKRYSAFFETPLAAVLEKLGCARLILAGINTHACIRTTAIDAYQRDYEVLVADDCTTSHDLEHHRATKKYLNGKITSFLSNSELIGMLASAGRSG